MEKRLIDANALFEEINRVYVDHYEKSAYKFIHDFFNAMRRRIRRAKTVEAKEVIHGNWQIDKSFMPFVSTCSECGSFYDVDGAFDWNYCPYCGAKMDGVQE